MAERSRGAEPPPYNLFAPTHVGIVADDLDEAMSELGAAWRTSWSPGRDGSVAIPFRDGHGSIVRVPLRTAWGMQGPLRVELVQSVRDTVWPAGRGTYMHHLGYAVPDLEAGADDLLARGLTLELTRAEGPSPRVNAFAFFRFPSGLLIELVSEDID